MTLDNSLSSVIQISVIDWKRVVETHHLVGQI